MTKNEAITKAIARLVSKGQNAEQAAKILDEEILSAHWLSADSTAYGLVHFGFCTKRQAPGFAAALGR